MFPHIRKHFSLFVDPDRMRIRKQETDFEYRFLSISIISSYTVNRLISGAALI